MKRSVIIGVSVVAVLALVWVALMSYVNTRSAALDVHVTGKVDRVEFYREDRPDSPVEVITTGGQETDATLSLPVAPRFSPLSQSEPARYYFIATQGSETYTSRTVCCETGMQRQHGTLTVRSLQEWEVDWSH